MSIANAFKRIKLRSYLFSIEHTLNCLAVPIIIAIEASNFSSQERIYNDVSAEMALFLIAARRI